MKLPKKQILIISLIIVVMAGLIFWFNSSFSDREEMLGIGILGSGAIYGICYWYYRSTGNFGNEKQD